MLRNAVLVALLGVIFGVASSPAPLEPTPASAASTGHVLYHAAWRPGLPGWQFVGGTDFAFGREGLTYDGQSPGPVVALAPFSVGSTANFAVQVTLRAERRRHPSSGAEPGYGIVVRESPQNVGRGVYGGFDDAGDLWTGMQIAWGTSRIGGWAYALSTSWNVFRLEVHGDVYRLFVNGRLVVGPVQTAAFRGGRRVGIASDQFRLDVKDFEVLALPEPHVRQVISDGSLAALYVDPHAMPGFSVTNRQLVSNQELARVDDLPLAELQSNGRIVSVVTGLSGGPQSALLSVVFAVHMCRTQAGAAWLYTTLLDLAQRYTRNLPHYADTSLPGLGDRNALLSFSAGAAGSPTIVEDLVLQSGVYTATAYMTFSAGATTIDQQVAVVARLLAALVHARG